MKYLQWLHHQIDIVMNAVKRYKIRVFNPKSFSTRT